MGDWRAIEGYPGYQVSREGVVLSPTRVLRSRPDRDGYPQVDLYQGGRRRTFRVHRLVALAFLPNPDDLPQVNHKNGVKTDNRAVNLEWCCASRNILHSYKQGRSRASGEDCIPKLDPDTARKIRRLRAAGATARALAHHYGVTLTTIRAIIRGDTYADS